MDTRQQQPILGLIGGIGSGKSEVASLLAQRGGLVISGDKLGHEALLQPSIITQVISAWGNKVLDEIEQVDRKKLAHVVFADPEQRRLLESIVFPYIGAGILRQIEEARTKTHVPYVVLDAAILLETKWDQHCDWIIYIHTPYALRVRRLAENRGWSEEEVIRRTNAQMPLAEKILRADYVVNNVGAREDLDKEITRVLSELHQATSYLTHNTST